MRMRIHKLIFTVFAMFALATAHAESTTLTINADVDQALADFRRTVKGADDYLAAAKGVLVIPEVKKAGLVVGAQWGEGALRINNKTVAYYKMKAGSVGMQAGYQKANYLFLFLTQESLDAFRKAKGWDAGAETGVTLVDTGVGLSADTLRSQTAVAAFIVGKEGLMAGYSLKGQKLTRFKPAK